MEQDQELIGLGDAARLARVNRQTIQDWERKGWLSAAIELAPRTVGRPGKLYRVKDVREIALKRGRNIPPVNGNSNRAKL